MNKRSEAVNHGRKRRQSHADQMLAFWRNVAASRAAALYRGASTNARALQDARKREFRWRERVAAMARPVKVAAGGTPGAVGS